MLTFFGIVSTTVKNFSDIIYIIFMNFPDEYAIFLRLNTNLINITNSTSVF